MQLASVLCGVTARSLAHGAWLALLTLPGCTSWTAVHAGYAEVIGERKPLYAVELRHAVSGSIQHAFRCVGNRFTGFADGIFRCVKTLVNRIGDTIQKSFHRSRIIIETQAVECLNFFYFFKKSGLSRIWKQISRLPIFFNRL